MLRFIRLAWIGKIFKKCHTPGRVSASRLRFHPQLEELERRLAPAVFAVNSLADTNQRDNVLTFREALMVTQNPNMFKQLTAAERGQIIGQLAVPGKPDEIVFNIPNAQNTPQTILAGSAEPAINMKPVIIDGTPPAGLPDAEIVLNGNNAGAGVDGLTIQQGGGWQHDQAIKRSSRSRFRTLPAMELSSTILRSTPLGRQTNTFRRSSLITGAMASLSLAENRLVTRSPIVTSERILYCPSRNRNLPS
jgi:hypothetical protein